MSMKMNRQLLLVCCLGLLVGLMTASATAQTWETRVRFSLNTKLEVPGAILEPGNYVMRVLNDTANRAYVQFLNEQENEVITTALTVPHGRLNATEEARYTVYERPKGLPEVLKSFYLPEEFGGHDFVYPPGERVTMAGNQVRQVKSLALLGRTESSGTPAKPGLP